MPLSEDEKKAIIALEIFKVFKKGDILLKEGQISKNTFFVLKGCIRCYYDVDGQEKTTAFYEELEPLSPLCSITGKSSEYYIACVEDSILIVGNPDMEKILFEKFPRFEKLCRILSEELLANNQATFDEYKLSSPEARYLNLLKTRPQLLQRVPQYQMASFLGITPQSLSRMRNRLIKK